MNSFKNNHLNLYVLQKIISWINLNELSKLKFINHKIIYGNLKLVITKSVEEFMQKKSNHSFKVETIKLCTILIENNKKLRYLMHNKNIRLMEAYQVHKYLNKIILW